MKKLGSKDCDWCDGYGFAVATIDAIKKDVQKCDSCDVYRSDFQVKQMLRSEPEINYKLGITSPMLDVSANAL